MDADKASKYQQPEVEHSFQLQLPDNTALEVRAEQGQYSFYLNEATVYQVQELRGSQYDLYIPPRLSANLGYYAFFNERQELNDETKLGPLQKQFRSFLTVPPFKYLRLLLDRSVYARLTLQSGLTFYSYYDGLSVLRSFISLDGDLIYQIRKDFLEHPHFEVTVSAHHWLTDQLLSRLRWNMNLLAWELAAAVPACAMTARIAQGQLYNPLSLLFVLGLLVQGVGWAIAFIGLWAGFAAVHYWLVNQLQKRFSTNFQQLNWYASQPIWLLVNVATWGTLPTQQLWLQLLWSLGIQLLLPWLLAIAFRRWVLPQLKQVAVHWLFAE